MGDSQELNFTVSSGLKNIIGRDLITDENVAVFELVKNSYDAGASHVSITIDAKNDQIIITDNGCGMSLDDLKNKWLFIAYSEKAISHNAPRVYAGSKGIGRFSCDRLGEKLVLFSQKDNVCGKLSVNWSDYDADGLKKIEDLKVLYEQMPTLLLGNENGTTLFISKLRDVWDEKRVRKTLDQLKRLMNPFQNDGSFSMTIAFLNSKGAKTISEKVKNTVIDVLKLATVYINCEIGNDSIAISLLDRGKEVYRLRFKNFTSIKAASFNVFFMDANAKSQFTKKMGVAPVNYGNIFIYRNNFRIYPYGEPNFDVFNLNMRKTQGYNRYLGGRDMLGWINIKDSDNHFIEATSRDHGFVNNQYTEELRNFYMDFVHKPLEGYANLIRFGVVFIDDIVVDYKNDDELKSGLLSSYRKYKSFLTSEELFGIKEKELSIDKKVDLLQSNREIPEAETTFILRQVKESLRSRDALSQELGKKVAEQGKSIKNLEHTLHTQQLIISNSKPARQEFLEHDLTAVSEGLDSIASDLLMKAKGKKFLSEISGEIWQLQKWSDRLKAFQKFVLRTDLDTKTSVTIDLKEFIKEFFKSDAAFSQGMDIKCVFSGDPIIRCVDVFDIGSILNNLYLNAEEFHASKFTIVSTDDSTISFVSDTGPLKNEIKEKMFTLGFSSRGGTGLGLYIVKQIVEDYKWTISIIGDETTLDVGFIIRTGGK